ncbi:MAG: (deoxy)nucleoside triphosphate pyrophosphohydrolase [Novosphingobium sp.]|nr:(deoxy)nucleoside triphosphate pyrophosphohydrolase [Novosphingobium sp.]
MENIPTAISVVCIALIDDLGRVLLQKRRPGSRHGGLWELPGGKVEPGESAKAALVREIAEELGIAVAPDDLRPAGISAEGPGKELALVLILYSCIRWCGEPRCLDGEAIGWFAPRDAAKLAVPPLDRPFIERLPEIIGHAIG